MMDAVRRRMRGDGERGDILVVVVVSIFVVALLGAIAATTVRMINRTESNRDFVWAEQLANQALSDALYHLNEGKYVTSRAGQNHVLPSVTTPRRNTEPDASGTDLVGLAGNGSWLWYAAPIAAPESHAGKRLMLTAVGNHDGTTREIRTELYALEVRSVSSPDGNQIVYTLSPRAAFSHAVFGADSVTSAVPAATAMSINGTVGTNGTAAMRRAPTHGTFMYNFARTNASTSDRCLVPPSGSRANCGDIVTVPASVTLDARLAPAYAEFCQGTATRDWVASEQTSPRIVANNNTLCVRDLVIDRNTQVIGNGFLHIYVSGSVRVTPGSSLRAPSSTPVIYTNSTNVRFQGSPTLSQTLDMYVYAPLATCVLGETSPEGQQSRLTINGSVACKSVELGGVYRINWSPFPDAASVGAGAPGSPGADLIYNRKIWHASNIQERLQ